MGGNAAAHDKAMFRHGRVLLNAGMPARLRLLLPLPVLALIAAWFVLGLHRHMGWQALAANHAMLRGWAAQVPALAALAYVAAYASLVALSVPLGGVMTMLGGLLFGAALGAVLAVLAATGGSMLLFLLARGVFAPFAARHCGPLLETLRHGIRRDGFSYVLAMRLIPVVPFWLSNLAPALAGMRLAPFAAATLLGIVPMTAVLAGVGAGLGDVLAAGGEPDVSMLRAPGVVLPLLGLAVLSLLPVAWRRWRRLPP